ncbi:5'/3'-nucleotidase SurE [Stetteria hydrogenophila]
MGGYRILVTNDDGIYSPGLRLLYEALRGLGVVRVLAPETPKSSSGLGITLHKPLRIEKYKLWGDVEVYATNGTPSDTVYMAVNLLEESFDLVASGVNIGDNTSIQVILSSGTVGAAAQAALLGIKAVAFSAAVDEPEQLSGDYASRVREASRVIAEWVLENGLPEEVDVLNVNYPPPSKWSGLVEVAPPARLRYLQKVTENVDPRGKRYYWLYGEPLEPEKDTDVYAVYVKGAVTLTPLSLNLTLLNGAYGRILSDLEGLRKELVRVLG